MNSAVEIHCHADGNPAPSLTFNDNGNLITPDQLTVAEAGNSLTGISALRLVTKLSMKYLLVKSKSQSSLGFENVKSGSHSLNWQITLLKFVL